MLQSILPQSDLNRTRLSSRSVESPERALRELRSARPPGRLFRISRGLALSDEKRQIVAGGPADSEPEKSFSLQNITVQPRKRSVFLETAFAGACCKGLSNDSGGQR
jgi:hypothetical protein